MINYIKTKIINTGRFIKEKIKWFLITIGVIGIAFAVSAPTSIPAEYITAPENNTYKIGQLNYNSYLEEDITSPLPLQYQLDDKYIAFTPIAMKWDNIPFKATQASTALIDKKKYLYKNVFGPGIDIDMNFGERVWEKVIKINSLEDLGKIPKNTEYLEVVYEVNTNFIIDGWNKKDDFEITETIRLGDFSYIEPAIAWDNYSEKVCEQVPVYNDTDTIIEEYVEECETLINRIKIKSFLSEDEGKLYLTKQVPVEWLKTAQYPIYTDTDVTYGTAVEFEPGAVRHIRVAKMDTNSFIVCYMDDDDADAGKCRVADVTGTSTISFGAIQEFTSDIGVGYSLGLCTIDTDRFALVYADDAQLDDGYTMVGEITGTSTISFGTAVEFYNGDIEYTSCTKTNTNEYAFIYNAETLGDDGYGCAATTTGTTTDPGTPVVMCPGKIAYSDCRDIDTNKLIATYYDITNSNKVYGAVATTSGKTIGFGTPVYLDSDNSLASYRTACDKIATDKFVAVWPHNRNAIYGSIGTVSGTTITAGATTTIYNASSSESEVVFIDSTHFVTVYEDIANSEYGKSNYSSFSGTTITPGTAETWHSAQTNGADTELIDTNVIIICYKDDADATNHGECIIGNTPSAGPAGTDMQINIGDAWKDIELMKINIGDSWKDVAGAWINIGDSWKLIY